VCDLETSRQTGLDPTSALAPQKDSQVTATAELSSTSVALRFKCVKRFLEFSGSVANAKATIFYVEGKLNDKT
jgi:hypothetical protein